MSKVEIVKLVKKKRMKGRWIKLDDLEADKKQVRVIGGEIDLS